MRSGTSCFDWTVFKKTICRFWPLWGAYFAIWLVVLPLNGLMLLRLDAYQLNGFDSYMQDFAVSNVPNAAGEGCLTLAVLMGALTAMAVFSHLYNARSANLFGSLPIRREGLFLTHYLAGLCFFAVPNLAIFLLTLAVEAAGGFVCVPALLFWLAVSCGECFLFYSMAVFCAMFTGHILALPVFYAVFNGIVAGVLALIETVLDVFYYGFAGYPGIVLTVMKWFTPAVQLGDAVSGRAVHTVEHTAEVLAQVAEVGGIWVSDNCYLLFSGLGTVGLYAIVGLALSAAAFFLYRARRLESAGDVVSVNGMKPVFKYGVAFCAGLVLGIATVFFTGGGEIMLIAASIVWGVIGCFAAQMLLDKSFRVLKKWKGAAVVAAVFAALFLTVSFDLTGFETRIPDPASVDSVYVDGLSAVYLSDHGDRFAQNLSDPELVKLVNILHREAVAQRDEERQAQAQIGGRSVGLELDYFLQGGGTLSRRYSLWLNPDEVNTEGTAAWAVQQLYDNHELYWQVYGFASLEERLGDGYRLESAAHGVYDEEYGYYQEAAFYGQDAAALLAAVKEDFFAGRIGVRRVDDEDRWYGGSPEESLTFNAAQVNADGRYTVEITIQDTASSTLAALEDMADRAVRDETVMDGYRE